MPRKQDYYKLRRRPNVPFYTNELKNNSGFITMDDVPSMPKGLSSLVNDTGFITVNESAVRSVNGNVGDVVLSIPAAQVPSDWNASSGVQRVLNKPTFAPVALSGSYTDLSGKPTIPAAQVNADWNSSSGVSSILNKPTIPAAQVNSDWSATSGVAQILNKPTVRRVETYLGTTDASGNYTVTYPTPFPSVPDVQPQLQAGTPSQVVRITSSTVNGFTVNVTNRASVTILGIEVLLAATTPVVSSSVSVLITARS